MQEEPRKSSPKVVPWATPECPSERTCFNALRVYDCFGQKGLPPRREYLFNCLLAEYFQQDDCWRLHTLPQDAEPLLAPVMTLFVVLP
jgi:hypothetical protein